LLVSDLSALPQEGDLATPNERARVWQQRQTLSAHCSNLRQAMSTLAEIAPKLEPLLLWRDVLRACQLEFERTLATLESLPQVERNRTLRQEDALRESLRIVQSGPDDPGGPEMIPSILYSWLESRAVRPESGRMFVGRGGLRTVTAKIADL